MNRIALAQINPTLGSFRENAQKIIDHIHRAKDKNCNLVVFPEAALFGYHPFDLLERKSIVENQLKSLKIIEKSVPQGITAIVGLITKNQKKKGRPYHNSAAIITKGSKTRLCHKELLPTGDVFDEARFIEPGDLSKNIVKIGKTKLLITICEDIWAWEDKSGSSNYKENPLLKIKEKVDLVINLSASPYFPEKIKTRKNLVKKVVNKFKCPAVYVNMVGAQDEIIFDGASFALDRKGNTLAEAASFVEDLIIYDLTKQIGGRNKQKLEPTEEIRQALVLGIRDFCNKSGLERVHFGLSGGIDSAVVACLATDALGPSKVTALAMPGPFSSPDSLRFAQELALNLNVTFKEIAIVSAYDELKRVLDSALDMKEFSLAHENLQARIRGLILMAYANRNNSLLLSTGNKSEYATGYTTLYGDMCGGLVPLGDLTKKQVYQLAQIYNLESKIIPEGIISRPPTAELRPNQKDQDSLPAYDLLDHSVVKIIENCATANTETDQWLLQALFRSEFKRWQAPPILKVSKHSFGRGRRLPIAHKAKE